MRIDRLELVNFRGFERLELELHPRLTLLLGINGSGKSNALEGLAVALGGWLRGVAEPEVAGQRSLERRDVRRILVEAEGVPSVSIGSRVSSTTARCEDLSPALARCLGGTSPATAGAVALGRL